MSEEDFNNDGIIDNKEIEFTKKRWETKRKIIWSCLILIVFFGFLFFGISLTDISEGKLRILVEIFDIIVFGLFTIIASYFGFSTFIGRGK